MSQDSDRYRDVPEPPRFVSDHPTLVTHCTGCEEKVGLERHIMPIGDKSYAVCYDCAPLESGEEPQQKKLVTDGGREDLRGTAGRHSHGLLLGRKWNEKAEENIHKWGHQRHDTVLLALIEEIGEIAMAFEAGNAPGGGPHPHVDRDDPHSYGRDLIHRMAELGRDTREFLEAEYPDPAGDGDGGHEYTLHGDPNSAEDAERIFEEVDDAAPLLFQLYWALERCDVDTGRDQPDHDDDAGP